MTKPTILRCTPEYASYFDYDEFANVVVFADGQVEVQYAMSTITLKLEHILYAYNLVKNGLCED